VKLYALLENLLMLIEATISEQRTAEDYAKALHVSAVHLRRLFKGAFGMTLASYVRSRRLAMSLESLLKPDATILEVALAFGFDHVQSYNRVFRQEFGLSPSEWKKSGEIVAVRPPLQLFMATDMEDGIMFGPEIVFLPETFCIGRSHRIPNVRDDVVPASHARNFWLNDWEQVPHKRCPNTYIGLTKEPMDWVDYTDYYPSAQVSDLSEIPPGFHGHRIPAGMYVKFHYVGEGHPLTFLKSHGSAMYEAIDKFEENEANGYMLYSRELTPDLEHGIYFERISEADIDGTYFVIDWFSPVYERPKPSRFLNGS